MKEHHASFLLRTVWGNHQIGLMFQVQSLQSMFALQLQKKHPPPASEAVGAPKRANCQCMKPFSCSSHLKMAEQKGEFPKRTVGSLWRPELKRRRPRSLLFPPRRGVSHPSSIDQVLIDRYW